MFYRNSWPVVLKTNPDTSLTAPGHLTSQQRLQKDWSWIQKADRSGPQFGQGELADENPCMMLGSFHAWSCSGKGSGAGTRTQRSVMIRWPTTNPTNPPSTSTSKKTRAGVSGKHVPTIQMDLHILEKANESVGEFENKCQNQCPPLIVHDCMLLLQLFLLLLAQLLR